MKFGDIKELIVALFNNGFDINLMSKDLDKKQGWLIDIKHGLKI